ncbi:UNVERIFIED_CONTAM: hypothetical protein Sradi_6992700 [Sesamum radiatum]|uniref:Reverse transcriptase domain-containing protein n=1 Tax=Sesamum radiatum TaxID=300843 RepID=A0AAW2JCN9_SESRA
MLPQWMFYVDYGGPGNRVWLAWDPNFVDVTVVETGAQFMHCSVYSFFPLVCVHYCGGISAADEFRGCLQDTGLIHLPMHGERFTWHNCSRDARSLWKRLDRLLVNDRWLENWPDTTYVSLSARTSDHSPLVLRGDDSNRVAGMFRFDNYLARSTEFIPAVQRVWRHHIMGSAMYAVTRKLKALKPIFRAQRQRKGDLSTNVSLAKGFLDSAQTMLAADRHCPTLLHLEFCCKVYRLASRLEQKMLHQRAKMAWMKDGDQCSRIFFRKVAKRRASKRVFQINTTDGRTLTSQPEVIDEFIRYYEELLGGTTRDRLIDLRYLRPWARHILTVDEAEALIAPVSSAEIRQAIFDIDETKAPGPDGYSAGFYKAAWSVIGGEVTQAILDFFRNGRLLKQINATLISLIPKVNSPAVVAEFRPISCCNVLYKAITKILVQRMRSILDTLISPSQNAFVPGRSIGDNVLLAQELFSGYNQRNLPPRCALKVDLRKAYDTVEWDFLKATLTLFGFPERFIQWIAECVTTPSYSVCINGAPHGFFRGEPTESHLILSRSAAAYRDSLLAILDFQEGHLPLRYLGLPLLASRLSISDCQPILRKIEARIKGWEGVMLSFAGRVQLIKSVLSALQVYWAMAFILPKHIIKEIEKRLRNFLWKGNLDTGYAKVSWQQVCRPVNEGGLGIRDIHSLNKGLMSRHLWRIISHDSNSIWVSWIFHYRLQDSSVWTIHTRKGTWGWRKLIRLRDALRPHVSYQIGDGTSFSLWHDPWHPGGPLLPQFPLGPRHTSIPPSAPLSTVISEDTWSWPHITDMESIDITHDLPTIHGGRDRILWTGPRGSFSSAAAYDLFRPPGPTVGWTSLLVGPFHIPRHRFILWLALQGRLATTDRPWLQHLGSGCVLCQDGIPESHEHLFFMCPFASECIRAIRREIFFHWPYYTWSSVIRWASARWRGKHVVNAAYRALFASLVYHLWQERNFRIFQHISRSTEEIVRIVVSETRDLIICKQLPRTKVLHLLIDSSQTAFVPGRVIADNILLAQELLAGYNQAKLPQRCTIKVDIQKAYDSVNWDFLLESLRIFQFPSRFIDWIEQCVSTVAYSVLLNGSLHGTINSVSTIKATLLEFAELSGLRVNPGFQEGSLPIKYLGVPLSSSRLTRTDCQPLLDKLARRLAGWNHLTLSLAGRTQVIKSVLNSLHIYWASAFLLPKAIIQILERKMREFLWKGSSGSGYAKVSWAQVCKSKEEGGLGIRSVLHMNQALMIKHVWRILQQDTRSLWVAWVLRYKLRSQSIWAPISTSASWCWKKVVKISSLCNAVLSIELGMAAPSDYGQILGIRGGSQAFLGGQPLQGFLLIHSFERSCIRAMALASRYTLRYSGDNG